MMNDNSLLLKANKNYISDLTFYMAFYTRNHRTIFDKEENQKLFLDNLSAYEEKNDISILEKHFNDDLVVLKVLAPPVLSPTEIVFNFKRFSANALVKANKDLLQGEHAIWTRQYAISFDYKNVLKLIMSKE